MSDPNVNHSTNATSTHSTQNGSLLASNQATSTSIPSSQNPGNDMVTIMVNGAEIRVPQREFLNLMANAQQQSATRVGQQSKPTSNIEGTKGATSSSESFALLPSGSRSSEAVYQPKATIPPTTNIPFESYNMNPNAMRDRQDYYGRRYSLPVGLGLSQDSTSASPNNNNNHNANTNTQTNQNASNSHLLPLRLSQQNVPSNAIQPPSSSPSPGLNSSQSSLPNLPLPINPGLNYDSDLPITSPSTTATASFPKKRGKRKNSSVSFSPDIQNLASASATPSSLNFNPPSSSNNNPGNLHNSNMISNANNNISIQSNQLSAALGFLDPQMTVYQNSNFNFVPSANNNNPTLNNNNSNNNSGLNSFSLSNPLFSNPILNGASLQQPPSLSSSTSVPKIPTGRRHSMSAVENIKTSMSKSKESEQKRRNRINDRLNDLKSMLPDLSEQPEKSSTKEDILTETIHYIQVLEKECAELHTNVSKKQRIQQILDSQNSNNNNNSNPSGGFSIHSSSNSSGSGTNSNAYLNLGNFGSNPNPNNPNNNNPNNQNNNNNNHYS